MAENWQEAGFGVYVHWPWCLSKCPYCDFNSHVAQTIDHETWRRAYVEAIASWSEKVPGRPVRSIFFGGGTPSLMDPATTGAIIESINDFWPLANDVEITLEANPTSVEASRLDAFRSVGVNRVSIGLQSLNDRDLKRLGRTHSADEGVSALKIAREAFDRVSFDLIYARQDQSLDDWRRELRQALSHAPDHLSLYQLTIEDGTVFGRRHAEGKLPGLPSDDLGADMYDMTQEICQAAGLPAYEVSNHARPGSESRHNLVYWRGGDWLGIGPGAHGRYMRNGVRMATESPSAPTKWLGVASREATAAKSHPVSAVETAEEYLMMSLRLTEGCDLDRYRRLGGNPLPEKAMTNLCDLGLIERSPERIMATSKGRIVLNGLIRELLAGV
jgi:putative oxygen-independent coproporphyrinogen III oxidase